MGLTVQPVQEVVYVVEVIIYDLECVLGISVVLEPHSTKRVEFHFPSPQSTVVCHVLSTTF